MGVCFVCMSAAEVLMVFKQLGVASQSFSYWRDNYFCYPIPKSLYSTISFV